MNKLDKIEQCRRAAFIGGQKRFANHPSQAIKAECVRLHTEENLGVTGIANRTGTNKSLVRKWLIQQGVYSVGHRKPKPRSAYYTFTKRIPVWDKKGITADAFLIQEIKSEIETETRIAVKHELLWLKHPICKRRIATITFLNRIKRDPAFRSKCYLRKRLNDAIKLNTGKNKTTKISKIHGCTNKELKAHIEKQFRNGMTWDNQGKVWELDHIRPLSSFNLNWHDEIKKAGHFTNIQPLFKHENRSKGARRDWKIQKDF